MRVLAGMLMLVVLGLLVSPTPAAEELELAIIVHPSRANTPQRRDAEAHLSQAPALLDHGHAIVAINQEVATPAREAFTRTVFGEEATRLTAYWNEQDFQGVLPPITLGYVDAVIRYSRVAPTRSATSTRVTSTPRSRPSFGGGRAPDAPTVAARSPFRRSNPLDNRPRTAGLPPPLAPPLSLASPLSLSSLPSPQPC